MPSRASRDVASGAARRLSPALERYLKSWKSAVLDDEAWPFAGDAIRDRVRACRPQRIYTMKSMLRVLALFLHSTAWWDRRSPLDLDRVLQPEAIQAFVHSVAETRSRPQDLQTQLLRLYRRQRVRTRADVGASSARRPVEANVAHSHQPDLVRGVVAVPNSGAQRAVMRPQPLAELPSSTSTWRLLRPGAPKVGTVMADTENSARAAATPPPKKKLSRAAAVAEAKRKHAVALGALRQNGPAPLPVLPPDVALTIAAYRPQVRAIRPAWDRIAPTCRMLAHYFMPASPTNARNAMWHLSRYLAWVVYQPHRVDISAILRLDEVDYPGLLERYEQEQIAADSTVENLGWMVRRALLHSRGVQKSPVKQKRNPSAPLGDGEVTILVQYAHHQRTPTNRRSMCFIVGLSLGAGLSGHDLAMVRRHHLVVQVLPDGTDVLTVEIVEDTESRVVVVAEELRPTVELAMGMHDEAGRGLGAYILGSETGRDGVVQTYIGHARAARPEDRPHVSCPQMRNTWLLAAMDAGIPVRELMQAAGLKYATTLVDLMGYCAPLDPGYVDALFANVHKKWRRS